MGVSMRQAWLTAWVHINRKQRNIVWKGFIIGLWYSGQAFADIFFTTLYIMFDLYYPNTLSSPSCGTVLLLIILSIIMFATVAYLILAKRYKLRERERHVNIQAIAEEHYERYLDQKEDYMREERRLSEDIHFVDL